MAIVAPGVVRYSVEATYAGQQCVNIFDFNISDEGIGTSRSDAIEQGAGDLLNQWSDHVLPLLQPEYIARSVSWIDLDSLGGSTGSRSSTDGSTWPEPGAQVGEALPGNVCMRVKKLISGTRGLRSGQTKLAGTSETWTLPGTPNEWDPAALTAVNGAFEDLKDGMNGGAGDYTGNLVVVHTVEDEYVDQSNITNFAAQPIIGSMRRRLPGYGM